MGEKREPSLHHAANKGSVECVNTCPENIAVKAANPPSSHLASLTEFVTQICNFMISHFIIDSVFSIKEWFCT